MAPTAPGEALTPGLDVDTMIRTSSRRMVGLAGLIIVLAGWLVYANSFGGPFIFDDRPSVMLNPTIRQGWVEALQPPTKALTVSGRPLMNLSLALNYHLGKFAVGGYHALNLIIQLLAGLTLFGLVRRTLVRPVLRERYGTAALPLAFFTALLWTVHPLQTESVTYIIQRAESLMGLFYLLTLYCFVRSAESSRAWVWLALSVAACLLGMFCKEVMVSAPLMVLLYDRTFVAGTFAGAWQQRRKFYAVLAGTWVPLAWLVATVSWPENTVVMNTNKTSLSLTEAGFGMKSFTYGLKQCEAVAHYLWLSVWPHPLVIDYGMSVVTNPLEVAPQMAVLALLLGGTIYALWRQPAWGFLGAWFFAILAPTSSVVPLAGQTMAEHHLYLSLAAVLVLAVLGLYALLGRGAGIAAVALTIALGGLTLERNGDYHSEVSIWTDTVLKYPDNSRAIKSLGAVLHDSGRVSEALAADETALRMNPNDADAENNLGSDLNALGRPAEARDHLLHSVAVDSTIAEAYFNLGNAYTLLNQPQSAQGAYLMAVQISPNYAVAHNNLGKIYLLDLGQIDQAIAEYDAAVRSDPSLALAQEGLGAALMRARRPADAILHFSAAIGLKPDFGEAYLGLGDALLATGRAGDAIAPFETAVRLMPDKADAHDYLGVALGQMGRLDDAVREFKETLRLDPSFPNARNYLDKIQQPTPPPANSPPPAAAK